MLVLGVRGEFAGLDLQGACGGVAGVAFGQMTAAWLGELARLSEQASALAGYLGAAADDYVRTDRFVFAAPSTVSHP